MTKTLQQDDIFEDIKRYTRIYLLGSKKIKRSSSSGSPSLQKKKKVMIYSILGIAIVVSVSFIVIMINSNNDFSMQDTNMINGNLTSELVSDSQRQSVEKFVGTVLWFRLSSKFK